MSGYKNKYHLVKDFIKQIGMNVSDESAGAKDKEDLYQLTQEYKKMLREIKNKNLITNEAEFFKINDLKNIILQQYDQYNEVNDDLIKLRAEIKIVESKLNANAKKTNINLSKVDRVDSNSSQNQTNRSTQRSKNVKEESLLNNLNSTTK